MLRSRLLEALLFFPARGGVPPGHTSRLGFRDVEVATPDGERLHAWWAGADGGARAHVLFLHGNGGNVVDRAPAARRLAAAGFDVLLCDYRGYGRSTGRPTVSGTAVDARAAHDALLARPGVDPGRVVILGESLGGAVALALALERPPLGLVLQSTFTSIRAMARLHYPVIPERVVPDVFPSLRLVTGLRAPLLVIHGTDDPVVPASEGRALHAAAPAPKRLELVPGVGHDVAGMAGGTWIAAIASWAGGLPAAAAPGP